MQSIEIDPLAVKERKTDDRGRVNLGPDYADQQVRVVVVDVLDDEDADA